MSFTYPDGEEALRDVGFELPEGGSLALVGPSGAGKSTLLALLQRFWDYDEGRIELGGVELRTLAAAEVRRRLAVVSQHTHLFTGTVRDNLLLARPRATDAELVAAVRRARLHDFLASLPVGYDTWIGEQGLLLSGGERQRLAIARAFLKDAPLLLLHEPTSHLDAVTERDLMAELKELMAARTTLVVTHRLRGWSDVGRVVVLDGGRVVEQGTHAELMASPGLYRRMAELERQAGLNAALATCPSRPAL